VARNDGLFFLFRRRFYAVTSRRYCTLSRCSNDGITQTMKHNGQQQQFVHNDKPMTQFSAHVPRRTDDEGFNVTAAERQYFVLDPEQQ